MIYDHDTPHLASNFGSGLPIYNQQYNVNIYCLVVLSLFPALCSFLALRTPHPYISGNIELHSTLNA